MPPLKNGYGDSTRHLRDADEVFRLETQAGHRDMEDLTAEGDAARVFPQFLSYVAVK